MCVALALYSAIPAAISFLSDQINAGVSAVNTLVSGPFGPHPDLGKAILVHWVLAEIGLDQSLEQTALFGGILCPVSYLLQCGLKIAQCLFSKVGVVSRIVAGSSKLLVLKN